MRVLKVGAGTGRYSHALARKGYRADAVELIEHNIDVFWKKTASGEPVTITQGNAMDLSAFGGNTYDITLLLGPMYHLFTAEDQLKALSEAVRVTKRGGVVFAAYCMSDASILQYGFLRGNIRKLVENSMVDPETSRPSPARRISLRCTGRRISMRCGAASRSPSSILWRPTALPVI